jgi:hypothetical protein
LYRPIATPLERRAKLLCVDLATVRKAAANGEPYTRADDTKVWSLPQLEQQLRPGLLTRCSDGAEDPRPRKCCHAPPGAWLAVGFLRARDNQGDQTTRGTLENGC